MSKVSKINKKKTIAISLKQEIANKLIEMANKENRSVSNYIETILINIQNGKK